MSYVTGPDHIMKIEEMAEFYSNKKLCVVALNVLPDLEEHGLEHQRRMEDYYSFYIAVPDDHPVVKLCMDMGKDSIPIKMGGKPSYAGYQPPVEVVQREYESLAKPEGAQDADFFVGWTLNSDDSPSAEELGKAGAKERARVAAAEMSKIDMAEATRVAMRDLPDWAQGRLKVNG
jgi:hypothetical protein